MTNIFIDILLILVLGLITGSLAKRAGLPVAVAYVLLGVVLGGSVLGWIETSPLIEGLGEFGVVLLLGSAGLHLGLERMKQAGWASVWVALFGIVLSFVAGYVFVFNWGATTPEAIYTGTALTATSIGISVQVLKQFGLVHHRVGQVVIAAAVIDDVIALFLLAMAHSALTEGIETLRILGSFVLIVIVLSAIFWSSQALARFTISRHKLLHHRYLVIGVVIVMLGFAELTKWLGFSAVVGAFFAGLGLGDGAGKERRGELIKALDPWILILVPFFFVLIGARAEWMVLNDPGMKTLWLGLLLIALLGKSIGGVLGALRCGNFKSRLLIGLSMVPRGEVALVIASLGFQQGHLGHHVFIAVILMTIAIAILGPLLMALLARRQINGQA